MAQPANLILSLEACSHLKIALLAFLHQPGELAKRPPDQPHQHVTDQQRDQRSGQHYGKGDIEQLVR
ncbi:hypothetical protein D3C81_1973390 [compost metagenome]